MIKDGDEILFTVPIRTQVETHRIFWEWQSEKENVTKQTPGSPGLRPSQFSRCVLLVTWSFNINTHYII